MKTKRISILLRTAFVLLFTVSAFSGTWAAEAYIDEKGESKTHDAKELKDDTATPLAAGWYIVKKDVTFNKMINCTSGDINLILADGAHLTINSGSSESLYVENGTLYIYPQSGGTGALTATTTSSYSIYAKNQIYICGGRISVSGNKNTDGIFAGGSVYIKGGTVSATGNKGINATCNLHIDGGTVSAYGTSYVGINAGSSATISGGTVTGLVRDNGNKKITLYGRTFIKDGNWNTLCLPFNATTAQLGSGVTVKELDVTKTSLDANGKLTLRFKDASSIEACKPYIVKWSSGTNVVNPYFTGVSGAPSISDASLQEITSNDGNVKFVGQFSPFAITADNINEILYIASGNKIGYSTTARNLKFCGAHFWVKPDESGGSARTIDVDFGDGETISISGVTSLTSESNDTDGTYYDLQGRRVAHPVQKGLYIVSGHKVLVK